MITFRSVNLETGGGYLEEYKNALAITAHLDAYDYLFENFIEKEISIYDLPELIKIISNEEYQGFRQTSIQVAGSKCERTKPYMISSELFALFKDYQFLKEQGKNPYLLEAIFHIRFLKIHPFGDGNGRTARILTCFHLIKNGLAPICIPKEKKSYYCDLIETNDYDKLALLFQELSHLEYKVMKDIWEKESQKSIVKNEK